MMMMVMMLMVMMMMMMMMTMMTMMMMMMMMTMMMMIINDCGGVSLWIPPLDPTHNLIIRSMAVVTYACAQQYNIWRDSHGHIFRPS